MKWFILFMISTSAFASISTPKVDRVSSMTWDGESFTVGLSNYQSAIKISGANAVIPCLENAQKSNMEVLITIDSDIPMIKSCKLYTPGLVNQIMQAQEEDVTSPTMKK